MRMKRISKMSEDEFLEFRRKIKDTEGYSVIFLQAAEIDKGSLKEIQWFLEKHGLRRIPLFWRRKSILREVFAFNEKLLGLYKDWVKKVQVKESEGHCLVTYHDENNEWSLFDVFIIILMAFKENGAVVPDHASCTDGNVYDAYSPDGWVFKSISAESIINGYIAEIQLTRGNKEKPFEISFNLRECDFMNLIGNSLGLLTKKTVRHSSNLEGETLSYHPIKNPAP